MFTRLVVWLRGRHGATWGVAAAVYTGWVALVLAHAALPLPVLVVLGGCVIAWHGSLQHETIHGHPSRSSTLRALVAGPPLALWLPYGVYRETHRAHHATPHLTDPAHDPESAFTSAAAWARLGATGRALARSQRTALGRLVLGPLLVVPRFLRAEGRHLVVGTAGRRGAWLRHLGGVTLVLAFVVGVAHLPLWKYLLAFVYPGLSLTLLRSLAEHRYDMAPERRTAVVEAGLFFRLLFLNNNLHVVHHRYPHLPWFDLPRRWHEERAAITARAPELVYPGYLTLVRSHALLPISRAELP